MDKNAKYYLGFSYVYGIGPMKFQKLLSHLGSVMEAYDAPYDKLSPLLGQKLATDFIEFRQKFNPIKKLEELRQKKIKLITQEDEGYPPQLKNISDPPICLYVRGDINLPEARHRDFSPTSPSLFAIVGTRKPTPYGEQITRKFAYELAAAGFVIVSGMAMGIDAAAHQSALAAGGKTIAVLGCGVDIIYPAANSKLYHQIIEKGGAIISEFPPGHLVQKGLFIARNRLISGLSRGVLVVEGLADSGSLITARYAAEQGKEVFAPPGPLTSPLFQAPNILLKQGAKLAASVEDIVEEFGLKILPKAKKEIEAGLTSDEKIIFTALQSGPKLVDEIIAEKNLTIETVLNALSVLEIKGAAEKNSEGKYQIKY